MEVVVQEPGKISKRRKLASWVGTRFAVRYARDGYITNFAAGGVALFGMLSMAAAVLGMPTGLGIYLDLIIFLAANAVAMTIATIIFAYVLSLLYVPLPRRLCAAWSYVGVQTYMILYFAELSVLMSLLFACLFATSGVVLGCLLGWLLRLGIGRGRKLFIAAAAACTLSILLFVVEWPASESTLPRAEDESGLPTISVEEIKAPDPSQQGQYHYQFFSYGSGQDKHRAIFGNEVDVVTSSVDASGYITKWPRLKESFWGFDPHALPINGRVWMPEGAGPFPLALIVHGNHLMEYFSDGGYDYLGELLASRGIIAVSVDENFLNYSVWSGIPNDDMKMRAWILLKHLQQINQFHQEAGTLFSDRVDMGKVALIGHSRGGQAAAMAADAQQWFSEDQSLDGMGDIRIQSVIAIAPTDTQVDRKQAQLQDINYLTLQGARDADVNNFYGERQYNRVSFSEAAEGFKAALYIGDANHSQFNTEWGPMDERLPGGLFLNRKGMLKLEEQQQISKLYIAAFLEATMFGNESYKALFQDYRSGMQWLPATDYLSRYEGAAFVELARFDQSNKLIKDAAAEGMVVWEETFAKDRDGKNKGISGLELEWEEPGAQYELELSPIAAQELDGMEEASLVFSIANLEWDLIASAEAAQEDEPITELEEANRNEAAASEEAPIESIQTEAMEELPPIPIMDIELTMEEGVVLKLELNELVPMATPIYTSFMSIHWLENEMKNEKYKQAAEPVFQTYVLPMEQFEPSLPEQSDEWSTSIAPDEIKRITFRFNNGPGKVMLADVGFIPKGDLHVQFE